MGRTPLQHHWGPPQQQWRQPPQWGSPQFPPQPPKKKPGGLGALLTLFLTVGAVVVGFGALSGALESLNSPEPPLPPPPPTVQPQTPSAEPTPSPEPTTVQPTPDPVATPEPAVTPAAGEPVAGLPPREWPEIPPPNSDDPHWVTLQQSVLYTGRIPALDGCPSPGFASTMAELEEQATAQMICIQAAWKPVLAELGLRTHDIPVYFFEGREVDTPCGRVSAPALYCSLQGGAIYFGETTINGSAWHPFGVKDMAGHEYGHHLQAESGFFEAEWYVGGGNENARRSELQATCMGYAMMAHDSSFEMNDSVYSSFEPYLRSVVEDGIHGSPDSLAYWGIRGLYSTHLANCNTWTSPSEDVD